MVAHCFSLVQQFGPSILGLLKSLKLREEGRQRQQQQTNGVGSLAAGFRNNSAQPSHTTGYSRYAQEIFNPKEGTQFFFHLPRFFGSMYLPVTSFLGYLFFVQLNVATSYKLLGLFIFCSAQCSYQLQASCVIYLSQFWKVALSLFCSRGALNMLI